MHDPDPELEMWDSAFGAATTLIEGSAAYQQQACAAPWVKRSLQLEQSVQSISIQMFFEACRG